MSGIYSLTSGAKVQQRIVENTANNLANANTVGYKADKTVFKQHLDKAIGIDLESSEEKFANNQFLHPYSLGTSTYAVIDDTLIDHTPGAMDFSSNPLDMAIQGNGFFAVETPQGLRYTRNGNFSRDGDGYLVDSGGNFVVGQNGRINILGKNINVLEDGTVEVDFKFTDKLRIVEFEQPEKLRKLGNNYFAPAAENQPPSELITPTVRQGMLEKSTTDTVGEMVNMIGANRIYEATQRGIKILDDIDTKSNSLSRM